MVGQILFADESLTPLFLRTAGQLHSSLSLYEEYTGVSGLTLNPTGSDLHVSSTGSEHHLGPSGGGGGAAGVALTRDREQE